MLRVAADRGRLVGMALLLAGRVKDGAGERVAGLAHLTGVAVAPPYRRKGLGSRIVSRAIADARGRGDSRMTLWVARDNAPAQDLFRQLGFEPDGRSASDASGREMNLLRAALD
jgi:ribosomal protein S18 acetylase RimI-like enzyme